MSEAVAEKAEKAPAAAGGGNKKLLLIVMVVNVLLAGGLGYVVISGRSHAAEAAKASAHGATKHGDDAEGEAEGEGEGKEEEAEGKEEEEEEEGDDKKAKHSKFGPLIEIGSFIANLSGPPGMASRYAKVSLHAEALNEEAKLRIEAAVVPLKAEALMVLSNAKAEDVIGQEKIIHLTEELLKRSNKLLGKKSIKHMYFSELVVQ
jgi:flagellar basal body-associated protein FliL